MGTGFVGQTGAAERAITFRTSISTTRTEVIATGRATATAVFTDPMFAV